MLVGKMRSKEIEGDLLRGEDLLEEKEVSFEEKEVSFEEKEISFEEKEKEISFMNQEGGA